MPIPGDEQFRRAARDEMAQSSAEFMNGVQLLQRADLQGGLCSEARKWFEVAWRNAQEHASRHGDHVCLPREWIDAHCAIMFCAMKDNSHGEVVRLDKAIVIPLLAGGSLKHPTGLTYVLDRGALPSRGGWCWYFDATVTSYDHLDQFDEAVRKADLAIAYFKQNNNPGNLGYHLSKRASILQQRASVRSRNPQTQSDAREDIVEAIRSMYESLSIFTDGWEEDCARPLATMRQVATRLGIFGSSLDFIDWSSSAGDVMRHFFDPQEKQMRPRTETRSVPGKKPGLLGKLLGR